MVEQPNEAFRRRQAQWNEFHRWQESKALTPISLLDRITWFFAAFNSSFTAARHRTAQDLAAKIQEIHQARECLAHLKRPK